MPLANRAINKLGSYLVSDTAKAGLLEARRLLAQGQDSAALSRAAQTAKSYFWTGATPRERLVRGAAAYLGVSAAGRILSGGGLYRDRYGNLNIIGLPLI